MDQYRDLAGVKANVRRVGSPYPKRDGCGKGRGMGNVIYLTLL